MHAVWYLEFSLDILCSQSGNLSGLWDFLKACLIKGSKREATEPVQIEEEWISSIWYVFLPLASSLLFTFKHFNSSCQLCFFLYLFYFITFSCILNFLYYVSCLVYLHCFQWHFCFPPLHFYFFNLTVICIQCHLLSCILHLLLIYVSCHLYSGQFTFLSFIFHVSHSP